MTTPPQNLDEPLLTVRAALIFLIALLAGVGGGSLLYLQNHSVPAAVMLGVVAFAGTIPICKSIVR